MSERVLIVHSGAGLYIDDLVVRFPDVAFRACTCPEQLDAEISSFRPSIAFSCVTHAFAREHHRRLLRAEALRWLHVGGSGYDHFRGFDGERLTVTNGRGVLAPFLADTMLGAIIALNHGFFGYRDDQRQGLYRPGTHKPLAGQRLLVVGAGSVGRALAAKASALDIKCHAVTRTTRPMPEFVDVQPLTELDEQLALADIVSVHIALNEATRSLFDSSRFLVCKPGALFANASRGGVVDEAALLEALDTGQLRAAYLDVFAIEPLPAGSELRSRHNLFMTPHCSDQVDDWQERQAAFFADNLERYLAGCPLNNRVSP